MADISMSHTQKYYSSQKSSAVKGLSTSWTYWTCFSLFRNVLKKNWHQLSLWCLYSQYLSFSFRMSSSKLIQSQLIALCRIYQSSESQCLFPSSPQKIHLSYTLSRLFELLDADEKICIFKQFLPIHDEKNINLWIALSISNFPMEFRCRLENEVVAKCKSIFDKFFASKIQNEAELHYLVGIIFFKVLPKMANTVPTQVPMYVHVSMNSFWSIFCAWRYLKWMNSNSSTSQCPNIYVDLP